MEKNNIFIKKGLIIAGIVALLFLLIYFLTDYFGKTYIRRDAVASLQGQNAMTDDRPEPTITPPKALSPEKQAILDAALARIGKIMASKDAKKIRALSAEMYPDKASQDALAKVPDSQVLKSAEMFVEYNVTKTLSYILPSLPDSAWIIEGDKATIVQELSPTRKVYFTATRVNGVWQ